MFCRQCGRQIPDQSHFCSYCGCRVWQGSSDPGGGQYTPPPPPPPPNRPGSGYGGPPAPGSGLALGLKIFAVICAALYLINGAAIIFQILPRFPAVFFYALQDFFYSPLYLFQLLLVTVIQVLAFIVYLWMCLVLILIAFKRNRDNSDSLLFGLLCGGALAALLSVVHFALGIFLMYGPALRTLMPLVGALLCVGGVVAFLSSMGEAPFATVNFTNLTDAFSHMIAAVAQACRNLSGNAGHTSTGAANAGPSTPPPNQPGYAPRRMPTDRSLLLVILLSIITCGIYSYYFIYCLARDVNEVCRDDGQKTGGLLVFILLSFITCGIYAIYWYYSLGNRLAANAPRYGLYFQENGNTILLWYLVGWLICGIGPFVAMYILIKNTNALCAAYNYTNGL